PDARPGRPEALLQGAAQRGREHVQKGQRRTGPGGATMSRWRIAVVTGLISVPFVAWAAFGTYYLWVSGWGWIVWWPLMACVALGYLLAWNWQRKRRLLYPPGFEVPIHWTARDQEAFKLVEARAKDGASQPAE